MAPYKAGYREYHEQEQADCIKFPVLFVNAAGRLAFQANGQQPSQNSQQQPLNQPHPEFLAAISGHDKEQETFAQPGQIGRYNGQSQ